MIFKMTGSRSYAVSLLEDDASIWPAVENLLSGCARPERTDRKSVV